MSASSSGPFARHEKSPAPSRAFLWRTAVLLLGAGAGVGRQLHLGQLEHFLQQERLVADLHVRVRAVLHDLGRAEHEVAAVAVSPEDDLPKDEGGGACRRAFGTRGST